MIKHGINVAVLGSTGFVGEELVDILEHHPEVSSIQTPGREDLPELDCNDTVFLALPAREAGKQAARFRDMGSRVIDLSGDLRFPTAEAYEKWYGQPHPAPHLLPTIYALPERARDELPGKKLASMPGCYPTATLLGILPLIENSLTKPDTRISVKAVSGWSGSGKQAANEARFADNVIPYNVGRNHRHVGEIEQFLDGHRLTFSPSVVGAKRGLLAIIEAELAPGVDDSSPYEVLQQTYAEEPFVKVLPPGKLPELKQTVHTNYCYIGVVATEGIVEVMSSIDNLRKGAASQAVQVFNLMHGFPETAGLKAQAND